MSDTWCLFLSYPQRLQGDIWKGKGKKKCLWSAPYLFIQIFWRWKPNTLLWLRRIGCQMALSQTESDGQKEEQPQRPSPLFHWFSPQSLWTLHCNRLVKQEPDNDRLSRKSAAEQGRGKWPGREGIETSVEGRGVGSPAASLLSTDCSEQSAELSSQEASLPWENNSRLWNSCFAPLARPRRQSCQAVMDLARISSTVHTCRW